jgi:hypothetical protein
MRVLLPKLIFLLLFSFSITVLNAQILDSLKSKTKHATQALNGLFKKNKNKPQDKSSQSAKTDQPEKSANTPATTNKPGGPQATMEEEEEYIELTSSYKNLKNLKLPSYKGKVKMGVSAWNSKKSSFPLADAKDKKFVSLNMASYTHERLLSMKCLDTLFNYLDTKKLSDKNGLIGAPNPTEESLSQMAQYHLMDISKDLCTDESVGKYFCTGGKCPTGSHIHGPNWGGMTNNEFERREAYLAFIKDNNHVDLRNWWNKLDREVYLVNKIVAPQYNFEKQGFDLEIDPNAGSKYGLYIPANGTDIAAFGSSAKSNSNQFSNFRSLLSMSAEEAKALRQRQTEQREYFLYVVFNIIYYSKVDRNNLSKHHYGGSYGRDLFYYLKNPKVEVFEDVYLKKKIGEVTLPVTVDKIETTEFIEITSPFKNFKSLRLQSFRNKVRLGVQSDYGGLDQRDVNMGYQKLLSMKFKDSIFNKLETKKLSNDPANHLAQKDLCNLGFYLCADPFRAKYFCPGGECDPGEQPHSAWGGVAKHGSPEVTEFDRHEAYQNFIKDNNHTLLRQWWNKLDREAYTVNEVTLLEYNFDKGGFEFTFTPGGYNGFNYIPSTPAKTPDRYAPMKNHKGFLAIKPEDAKELKKRTKSIYMVFEIVFYSSGAQNIYEDFTGFYLKTSKVEFFEDVYLKKKIGEGVVD